MALAQELVLFRDDGANLAVCTAPLPSNLAKHNSNGKSLLRSESQVQTKLEEPGAAASNSLLLQDEGTPCCSRCHLASEALTASKLMISPNVSCAKWELWELATSQTGDQCSDNLNSRCSFNPRRQCSPLLIKCGRQDRFCRKPVYKWQVNNLKRYVTCLSEERMSLTNYFAMVFLWLVLLRLSGQQVTTF